MRIVYLLESTCLCGGVKVVLRQAEALLKRGHHAVVISKERYPVWFKGNILFQENRSLITESISNFDHIIATTPDLILSLWKHPVLRGKIWHLVQGYEADYREAAGHQKMIDEAYSLPVPKLTVSASLVERLIKRYTDGSFYCIGQGLESQFFYPSRTRFDNEKPDHVFLIGPLTISIKQISLGLEAFHLAAQERPELELVRITSIDTREEEEPLCGKIHEYYVHVSPEKVGELLRSTKGIFISPSSPGEGFGLPALEAMACGVPTVLTDIPSYRGFARPCDYSIFVPCNDAVAMARAVCHVIDSDKERESLIRRGLETAALFSYDRVAASLEGVLSGESRV